MNRNGLNGLQINFSGIGCWLTLILGAWLLGTIGLGWIVKSVVAIAIVLILTPFIAFIALRLWLKRNLIEGSCPVCRQPLTGIAPLQTPCPNCGTALQATRQGFVRVAATGTIDVQAVDVETMPQRFELPLETNGQTIDVEVKQLPETE